jgi:hypothetical protein
MHTAQTIADFGKAATALHKLLHEAPPLTKLQLAFISTELHTLQVALDSYNSKNSPQEK